MELPLARQCFYQEIQLPDDQINLERVALFLAQEAYPDLDIDAYIQMLDTMAAAVSKRLPLETYPLKIIKTINQYLYEDLNFYGNTIDYYDPRNSFLNEVMDRRTGIPITLSLVYLAIAKRLNFPMVGVGMPGHFIIRPVVNEMEVFVDAFHQGEILFTADCAERLAQIYQRPITIRSHDLEAVNGRAFLARMLTNLKMIYLNQGDIQAALAAIDRILLLFPDLPLERRDRGLLYYRLDRFDESRQDLEAYLTLKPTAEDSAVVRQLLSQIRQR